MLDSPSRRAAEAHDVLLARYRSPSGLFRLASPARAGDRFGLGYWWQAHALDALVDASLRAPSAAAHGRIEAFVRAIRVRAPFGNAFYDDMAWMALALLRAGRPGPARRLWRRIQAGWSDRHGGGIAWSRRHPGYKNVPANGPAAILAARLHQRFGAPADLDWARRITAWIDETLVDAGTGLVWDGIGRQGGDQIDRDWLFTYTHGVVIGAHTELLAITGAGEHRARITATVNAVLRHLTKDGVLQDEGPGDGALFRGVLARYLSPVDDPRVRVLLERSAEAAWAARDAAGRFGPSWHRPPTGGSQLSAHLSGLILLEGLAAGPEPRR